MRKLLVLVILLAILGGGYYVFWHKMADEFRQQVVAGIDNVNTNVKPLTKDLSLVRYDSVSVTGFPSAWVVEISKPVFDVPVTALLQQLPPAPKGPGIASPAAFEWVEEVSYADKLSVTRDFTGNHFTLTASGDRTQKTLVNHAVRHTVSFTTQAPAVCHLDEHTGSTPWKIEPLFTDPQTFFNNFRSVDCKGGNLTAHDGTSNAELETVDGYSITIGNEADGTNHKVTLTADVSKFKVTPAFDAMVGDYTLMLYTLQGKADQITPPAPLSAYGEQNIKVDIAYDGPTDQQSFIEPNARFRFDVNALNIDSGLGKGMFETHIASAPAGNDRSFSFALHEHLNQTAQGDIIGQKRVADMLASLQKAPPQTDPFMQLLQKVANTGEPAAVAAKVFPQLHDLGDVAVDVDANVKGPNKGSQLFTHGLVTVDAFNITTTPYGVKAQGKANSTVPGKMPTADFSITCLACDGLITDLGNYAMRVESVINAAQKSDKPPVLTPDLLTGARQFIHGVAQDGNARDLVIHLAMNDGGSFTVSGKQVPEVIALYMTTIAPRLPQPSPSAGGQPPASLTPAQ